MTDFIQGFIMIFGAIAMMIIIGVRAGGIVQAASPEKTVGLQELLQEAHNGFLRDIPVNQRPSFLTIVSLVFMTSFGTWGLPQMVQKFYAIKNEAVIKKAAFITTIFALIIGVAVYFTGSLSHIFFDNGTVPKMPDGKGINYDMIMPVLLSTYLPEILLAVIMLLILSASMSTLSSIILVSSSAVTIDLYKGYLNPSVSEKQSVLMMRIL